MQLESRQFLAKLSWLMLGVCLVGTPLPAQTMSPQPTPSADTQSNPWLDLMTRAAAHAAAHQALPPVLSPWDHTVAPSAFALPGSKTAAGETATVPVPVPVQALQRRGVRVVPWTTNDPEAMRAVLRTGVDGLISDRPDLLQEVLQQERAAHPEDARLQHFIVSAHRGGRGLRPENTLPSFESGLDQLATELETDTGVSTDGVSLIWHDQFYNPQSCRRADGSAYTLADRVYLRDISSTEAQKTFICDKLHFGPMQMNSLALSPVAVAFATREGMPSPYAPTYVAQLFRFVAFYAEFYTTGPGLHTPGAAARAANARSVHFNLETKIVPAYIPPALLKLPGVQAHPELLANHTVEPQAFVTALAGAITQAGLESRCDIQSFDFRTLQLVEEQFPKILTVYLTEDADTLNSPYVEASLRAASRGSAPR